MGTRTVSEVELVEAEQRDHRKDLAVCAACEIEELAEALRREVGQDHGGSDLRRTLLRITQLSQLMVSSLEDYGCSVNDLEDAITGGRLPPGPEAKEGAGLLFSKPKRGRARQRA